MGVGRPSTRDQDLAAAARFLRGDPQGADVRALNRVANYLEGQLRTRERSKEKERSKRKARTGSESGNVTNGHADGDAINEGRSAVVEKP